jgi:hypothetical protein
LPLAWALWANWYARSEVLVTGSPSSRSPSAWSGKRWWKRLHYSARSQLRAFPRIELAVRRIWRAAQYLRIRLRWWLLALRGTLTGSYDRELDLDKIPLVSPERIVYCSMRGFNIHKFRGHVHGGDWDRLEKRFEDLDVYHAFREVCLEGRPWRETTFYQWHLDIINRGYIRWGCRNQSDLDRRCRELELLFATIRQDGYRSQRELLASQGIHDPLSVHAEVTVSIGRHGDLLFSDGAHRLAIAKLLGIPSIPVVVAVRHKDWMGFRKELLRYRKGDGGSTCQPAAHPDLGDMPAWAGCDDIFKMIRESVSVERGRLLDIGAKSGFFCHRFEDEGFDCYAVEDAEVHLYFLRKLKRAENKAFRIIPESALDCREIRNTPFEVTLALNVLHSFLETRDSYGQLVDLLENLSTNMLFFAPHLPDEAQMRGAFKRYSPGECVEFLLSNSRLTQSECIGNTRDGRPLYKLS